MSLASDLASNLAMSMVRRLGIADLVTPPLTTALEKLDEVLKQLSPKGGLDKLGSLLMPAATRMPTTADIADRLAACMPFELKLIPSFFGPGAAQQDAQAKWRRLTQFPPAPPIRNTGDLSPEAISKALLKAFSGLGPIGLATIAFHDAFSQITADMLQVFKVSAGPWTAGKTIDSLSRQAKKWADDVTSLGGSTKNLKAFQKELTDEILFKLPIRLAVAAVFSVGGHLLIGEKELAKDVDQLVRGVGSNKSLGSDIHRYYQERYRSIRILDLIEQDDRVYGTPIRNLTGLPLKLAAEEQASVHGELLLMYAARQSLQPIDRALKGAPTVSAMMSWSIRDDNVNFSDARVFEIKPVRSAWTGVIQEFYYRNSFNLMAAANKDLDTPGAPALSALAKALGVTLAGRPVVQCEKLYPGFPTNWPELATSSGSCRPFPLNGRTYAVMATIIDSLPGVVMYWIFEFPLATLVLLFKDLRDFLNKSGKRIADAATEVLVWVIAIAIGVAAVALLLAIIVGGQIELPALIPYLAPLGPLLQPVINGLTAFQSNLQSTSKKWTVTPSADAVQGVVSLAFEPQEKMSFADFPTTSLCIGFLRIEGIPVDAGQHLGAVIQAGLTIAVTATATSPTPKA